MKNDKTSNASEKLEPTEEVSFYLSDEDIKEVIDAVRAQDSDTVHSYLKDLTPANTAELLGKISEDDREELLAMYGETLAPETFTEMNAELSRAALSDMPVTQAAQIISELTSDDALELTENLEPELQQDILERLSAHSRIALEEGMNFPEDSAGRLMKRELIAIPQFWTIGKTIDYLRENAKEMPETFFDLFIVDPAYHIVGEVQLNKLICGQRSGKIEDIVNTDIHAIPATIDQEEVAHIFRAENLISAPVIDEDKRLIGVITIDDIVDVIDAEAEEDILRMAGVEQDDLYRAVLSTSSTRFRWLFLNLLTAIAASVVISFFDGEIKEIVALAILMPIVASMGGNAGTQAMTVAVRALAKHEISSANTWRVIWKELLVGTLNGAAFATISGVLAAAWFGSPMLGVVISLAMVINLIVAGVFGAGIPIAIDKMGGDPAISSTVLLTTVTDIVGFLAFLGLAAMLLF